MLTLPRNPYLRGVRTRARILQAVAGHHAALGVCPTLREIAQVCDISLVNTHYHVTRLLRDGWLEMDYGRCRTLRLAERDGRPAVTVYAAGAE